MKGEQTLELTAASVQDAIQEYLDRHFVNKIKVESVYFDKEAYGTAFTMKVQLEQIDKPSVQDLEKLLESQDSRPI